MEQPSPCAPTIEPVLYSPGAATTDVSTPRARAPPQEKPLQLESSPHLPQLEQSIHSNEDPALTKTVNKL